MLLIDKEGRVFGKANILDITILMFIFLIGITLLLTIFYPRIAAKQIIRMPQQKEVFVSVLIKGERTWLARYIKTGDGQKDLENRLMAEVVGIEEFQTTNNNGVVLVELRLKANIDESSFMRYGSNLLRPGQDFVLETKGYLLKGVVYSVRLK